MRLRQVLAATLVTVAAAGLVGHAVAARRREAETRRAFAELAAGLELLGTKDALAGKPVHVVMNGTSARIEVKPHAVPVADAASAAAAACGNDAETGGGGGEGIPRFERVAVRREDAADASAVLCVFRAEGGGERRERLSLVRRTSDAASSEVTVTRDAPAELERMFPLSGDAPGDDLAGVPRPAAARRVFAANVVETGHAVRIYEADAASEEAIDRQMTGAGFAVVTASGTEGRLYTRGAERIVAVVERTPSGTRIALARTNLL